MYARLLPALTLSAGVLMAVTGAASAADTHSVSNFLNNCDGNAIACKETTLNVVTAAKDNHYGCIPHRLSEDRAAQQELDWLRYTARGNPKYEKMDLQDVLWSGVKQLWPCRQANLK